MDTAFQKDLNLQGCTILTTSTVRPLARSCLILSSSWEDDRAGAVTTFGSREPHPRVIGEAEIQHRCIKQHCRTAATSYTHRPRLIFFHRNAHVNGKLQTKGPLATPSQVSWSIGSPYVPPMEARSVLARRRELAPRGMNEAKNHHATMATHPSLLAI